MAAHIRAGERARARLDSSPCPRQRPAPPWLRPHAPASGRSTTALGTVESGRGTRHASWTTRRLALGPRLARARSVPVDGARPERAGPTWNGRARRRIHADPRRPPPLAHIPGPDTTPFLN